MANTIYRNEGNLFSEDSLVDLSEYPEWELDDEIEAARDEIEDLYEKRESILTDELSEAETQYEWISYVLRALDFCFSVVELTPEGTKELNDRPDFTLFASADAFSAARERRGTADFFDNALAVMRGVAWGESLDMVEDEEGREYNPAMDVDRFIRDTGVEWGILTNGRIWRLYHKASAGLMDTFYEVDLISALESIDTDAFKYFWAVFGPRGLGADGDIEPLVQRLRRE